MEKNLIKIKEQEKIKPDRVLDCVGQYCPAPILNSAQEMEKIEPGQVLEMFTGDPAAVQDMPRWAKCSGHRFLRLFKEGEDFHFLIRKGKN